MKKVIFALLIFMTTLFAVGFSEAKTQEFLKPEDAFRVNVTQAKNGVDVNITLGKNIYIYQDSIKITLQKPSQKNLQVTLPNASTFHDQKIYENALLLHVQKGEIQDIKGQYTLNVSFEGCSKSGVCYSPVSKDFLLGDNKNEGVVAKINSILHSSNMDDFAKAISHENIVFILILFFAVGVLLSLTPCVFPMIPILSSIIISQTNGGKPSVSKAFFTSLVYVVAMSFTYAVVGVVAGLLGVDMQSAMQNPWVLTIFALIFVALAFSLFGYYEIGLPVSWQSKITKVSDKAGNRGGVVGTAIMGLLSALIVGPCVAPALGGAILFISQSGDVLLGGIALFVMSFGMGLPLLLVGVGAGKWMPRPGGWMSLVSKFFGLMMLILALIMISRVVSAQATMLLASIVAILTLFGIYANRKLFTNIFMKSVAILVAIGSFVLAIVWLYGAFSNGVSALTPLTQECQQSSEVVSDYTKKPNDCVTSAKRGYSVSKLLSEIKTANKPAIVDFTKESCSACKELEVVTFANSDVKKAMSSFKFIQVDVTDNTQDDQAMLEHFGIFGTPNILFFDANGNFEQNRTITGFIKPKEFIKRLEK